MALPRKSFLLRVDPSLLEAVQRWANDDLRSLNAQIEFLLRRALAQVGRSAGHTAGLAAGAPATRTETFEIDDESPADDDA